MLLANSGTLKSTRSHGIPTVHTTQTDIGKNFITAGWKRNLKNATFADGSGLGAIDGL